VRLSAARFGAVPRDYIECSADRAISLARQRRMQAVWPVERVRTLAAGHSPFLSAPAALAEALIGLAAG
jgi:pimeloyl-ACP methyl ester carboxylesterase